MSLYHDVIQRDATFRRLMAGREIDIDRTSKEFAQAAQRVYEATSEPGLTLCLLENHRTTRQEVGQLLEEYQGNNVVMSNIAPLLDDVGTMDHEFRLVL